MSLNVVLVRTEYPGNIGSTARAMANMGADRMILVDPKCDHTANVAHQMAAGAQQKLEEATVYTSWTEFYAKEPDGLRIALTRRGGRKRKVLALGEHITEWKPAAEPLYLFFGPEADGLDAADLALVNVICRLPTYGDFGSLNLAQAVLLALHIVRQVHPPVAPPRQITGKKDSVAQPLYFPDALIKEWLTAMGFDIRARRSSAYLTLRRLFMQNRPTKHEMQVLEAVLQQNIRKLKTGGRLAPTITQPSGEKADSPQM